MSFDFEYTKEFDVDSSLVEGVYFNENDSTVVLDLNDNLYRYSNVDASAVGDLVSADSVGAYYNTNWKHAYGPAEYLGHYDELDWPEGPVPVEKSTPGTPKGLTVGYNNGGYVDAYGSARLTDLSLSDVSPTTEHSLAGPVKTSIVQPVSGPNLTKEHSLAPIEDKRVGVSDGDEAVKVTVHFTLAAYGKTVFKFVAENSVNSDEAIDELNEYVARIGAVGKVRKVVVKFV